MPSLTVLAGTDDVKTEKGKFALVVLKSGAEEGGKSISGNVDSMMLLQ
jgi:hypothetical protein